MFLFSTYLWNSFSFIDLCILLVEQFYLEFVLFYFYFQCHKTGDVIKHNKHKQNWNIESSFKLYRWQFIPTMVSVLFKFLPSYPCILRICKLTHSICAIHFSCHSLACSENMVLLSSIDEKIFPSCILTCGVTVF